MKHVVAEKFKRGYSYWSYIYVSKNEIQLDDSWLGFVNVPYEDEFLDLHFSQFYSSPADEDEDDIFGFKFSVNNRAQGYERAIWNLEEALGWIGGFMGIILATVELLVKPFTSNELIRRIASKTKIGEDNGLTTLTFKCHK